MKLVALVTLGVVVLIAGLFLIPGIVRGNSGTVLSDYDLIRLRTQSGLGKGCCGPIGGPISPTPSQTPYGGYYQQPPWWNYYYGNSPTPAPSPTPNTPLYPWDYNNPGSVPSCH